MNAVNFRDAIRSDAQAKRLKGNYWEKARLAASNLNAFHIDYEHELIYTHG